MTFSAEEVRPVASYMRNVGKNQAADMLEAMTDMHREGFERHMRAKHFCTQEDLKLIGHRYLSAWIDHAWDAWTAALRYRDEQEKQA